MKTSLFDFSLPESHIATQPASPRDSARMLVVDDGVQDRHVRDLLAFLKPGDIMVFNDTRVIPARLFGRRGEGKVEILLHKRLTSPSPHVGEGRGEGTSPHSMPSNPLGHTPLPNPLPQGERGLLWQCFAKPAKRLKPGDCIVFADDFQATVMEKLSSGQVVLQFLSSPSPWKGEGRDGGQKQQGSCSGPPPGLPFPGGGDFYTALEKYGHMPLPPYIERADDAADRERYQTVYARHEGSVAAPTAGLHFTDALLAAIDAAGVVRAHVTLHVGGGTFLPVKVEDTAEHVMHSEYAEVSAETAAAVNRARAAGGRVIAVGTTSLRTLESASDADGTLRPFAGETDIFITPGYRFRAVDLLLTNFHLPRSTLFMLVSAFCGLERIKNAYAHAISRNYRFYSYGDACLLFPKPVTPA